MVLPLIQVPPSEKTKHSGLVDPENHALEVHIDFAPLKYQHVGHQVLRFATRPVFTVLDSAGRAFTLQS